MNAMDLSDSEFLDDLDRREHTQMISPAETLRLWRMCEYRIPNASIRAYYFYGNVKHHTAVAREKFAQRVLERLTS